MTIEELEKEIITFRDARNWKQFHNPKDSAIALVMEANEVLEHFLWKNEEEMTEHIKRKKQEVGEELIDTLYWVLLMCHDLQIDIDAAFKAKLKQNEKKYPIEKAKNSHKKYTEY